MNANDEQSPALPADVLRALAAALAEQLAAQPSPSTAPVPIDVALWTIAEVANYLRVSEQHCRERLAPLPSFPRAIRLPSSGPAGRGAPRWRAREVIDWSHTLREGSPSARGGRPRTGHLRTA